MSERFTWNLILHAEPRRVFGSLVRAASLSGRVCGIEDYGTVLTFTATRSRVDVVGQLRATVQEHEHGTLVRIEPAVPSPSQTPMDVAQQARSLCSLIAGLRLQYLSEPVLTPVI